MAGRLIYIAGRYTDATDEDRKLIDDVAKYYLQSSDIPITPTKTTYGFDEDKSFADWGHNDWLERFCFPLLQKCNVLCVATQFSKGVITEVKFASILGIPIKDFRNTEIDLADKLTPAIISDAKSYILLKNKRVNIAEILATADKCHYQRYGRTISDFPYPLSEKTYRTLVNAVMPAEENFDYLSDTDKEALNYTLKAGEKRA